MCILYRVSTGSSSAVLGFKVIKEFQAFYTTAVFDRGHFGTELVKIKFSDREVIKVSSKWKNCQTVTFLITLALVHHNAFFSTDWTRVP